MNRKRAFLCALLVALSAVAAGPAAAQEDLVTLTVTVETPAGDPVRGATLTATWDDSSISRTTAANGKAFVDVPDGADVEIRVDHDDYVRNFPLTVEDAETDEVSMTVYEKSTVTVVVEDGEGRVSGALVTLRKNGDQVAEERTDDEGVFASDTIEAGDYSVTVGKAGYYVGSQDVDVEGDTEETVTIERGTVTLEVNVTDDHFDPPRPVGGATVEVGRSGSVTTQPGGIGRISVPVNAWAGLTVTKDGYETTEDQVYVREEDTEADLAIQRTPAISIELLSRRVVVGESVSLTVTDEYGDPVGNATVRLDDEEVAETGPDGQAVVRVESRGNHTVAVASGSLDATAYVQGVGEGETAGGGSTDAEADTTDGPVETTAQTPGFGVAVALLALLLATLVGLARRSGRP